jgi:hypothetical protein
MIYNQPDPLSNPPQFPFGLESASQMLQYDPFEDILIPAGSPLLAWLEPGRRSQSDLLLVTGRCEYEPLPSGRPISKSARLQSRDGPALSYQHSSPPGNRSLPIPFLTLWMLSLHKSATGRESIDQE